MVLAAVTAPPSHLPHAISNSDSSTHHRRLLLFLNSCTCMSQLKQLHAQTIRTTSSHHPNTFFLYSRILHFSSLHDLRYAFRVFHQIENPNSFMWNALIRACARSTDRKQHAIALYHRMLEQGSVMQDKHTFPFFGPFLCHVRPFGLCKGGVDRMSERSLVSWNVVIDAFVRFGEFDAALNLFGEMQKFFEPDGYTIQSIANACAGMGSLSLGMWAHVFLLKKLDADRVNDVLLNTSLVDMYCKCGSLELALQLFHRMPKRDVTSWNSMILGFSTHGEVAAALEYFGCMGRRYFDVMVTEYKIKPELEHYGCLVDLLARAGLIDEALDVVSNMPMRPDLVIWRSLLDACCKQNAGVELSEEMASRVLEAEGGVCSGVYVLLSRVYASASRWNDVGMVRKLMTDKGVVKEPGCSSIEIAGVAHEFFAGDTSHPQTEEIYSALDVIEERVERVGYSPDSSQAPMVDETIDGKQYSLRLHSERLAIAFGLLKTKPGMPIRIFKNLRVCNNCHQVTKLISRVFNREIIVRDRVRFHHFKDGACSCMDYW
ncbi:Pentatricopeptide repeat-containing protein, chloroplastic/mitochondrial [Vitis vinifera]|uniref:Pentatricopeptide repeat-containing protein, chloroplastic/mitochondrial n=1 Tax=Vitis vinifera TaxID=29760 RepID=A0A438D775_VITVI|nr:Pentatricopeptide repeat-containing protein, chloroplastic/mitochondrial [Vitis vinifera]